MGETAAKPMTLDEFLAWEERQERKYEFVDGEPRLMTGGTQAHSRIGVNVLTALYGRLRGSPCQPNGSDLRVPIPGTGHSRYPDVTVDCGPYDPSAHDASEPAVVFEVLSKSTAWYDQTRKLDDYETVGSIAQYVCVSQFEVRVSVWTRNGTGRFVKHEDIVDGRADLTIPSLDLTVPLVEIYERTGLIESAEAS